MIISNDDFFKLLEKHIKTGDDFYLSLLENIIDNPLRYCGLFRLSNAKSKVVQNVTQSREIKFGDIFEELTSICIERLGYTNLIKKLKVNDTDEVLNLDQFFKDDDDNYYLVEMKIRDDHDSTKKRGQYQNFHKKVELVRNTFPKVHIDASMWFVDDSLVKNKKYYLCEMQNENFENTLLHLYYGSEFFASLKAGNNAWNEIISILTNYRSEHKNKNDVDMPDFGTSQQILEALCNLSSNYWKKLMSDNEEYRLLRDELFSSGDNLQKAKAMREKNENEKV